jgi:hypothetical protein
MGGVCSTNGKKRTAYRIFVEKPEGKRPLGRPRRRWVDNINMDLREIGWDGVMWILLLWLRIGTSGGLEPAATPVCTQLPVSTMQRRGEAVRRHWLYRCVRKLPEIVVGYPSYSAGATNDI